MLYLLCHLVHSRRKPTASRGITSTPWTEYVRFLPRLIPTPTMWEDAERLLLNGTSLQVSFAPDRFRPWVVNAPALW